MTNLIDIAKALKEKRVKATPFEWRVLPGEYVGFVGQQFFRVVSNPPDPEDAEHITSNRVVLENAEFIAFAANHSTTLADAFIELVEAINAATDQLEMYNFARDEGRVFRADDILRNAIKQYEKEVKG